MLRITLQEGRESTLKLEGKVQGPWVLELQRSWQELRERGKNKGALIDMWSVSFIDSGGKDLLLQMEREGARLVNLPAIIKYILGRDGERRKDSETGN